MGGSGELLEGSKVEPERRELLPRETLQVDGLALALADAWVLSRASRRALEAGVFAPQPKPAG